MVTVTRIRKNANKVQKQEEEKMATKGERESEVIDGIEVNKLAAPQAKMALHLAAVKKSKEAVEGLIRNRRINRKQLQELMEQDKDAAKFLKSFLELVPEKSAGGGGSGAPAVQWPTKLGEEGVVAVNGELIARVPLELVQEAWGLEKPVVKPGKSRARSTLRVKMIAEKDRIILEPLKA